MSFYLSAASLGVILWSYILNIEFIKFCSDLLAQHSTLQQELFNINQNAVQVFFYNYVSQTFLALVFCFSTVNLSYFTHKKFLIAVLFIFPTLINAALPSFSFVTPILVSVVTCIILVVHLLKCLPNLLIFLHENLFPFHLSFNIHHNLNLFGYFWTYYKVTQVLQLFTTIRLIKIFIYYMYDDVLNEHYENIFSLVRAKFIMSHIVIISFENVVAISGTATVLSLFVEKVYNFLQEFLIIPKEEQISVSAMFSQLLVLLGIKFSVMNLPPSSRLNMVSKISWVMLISVLSRFNVQINKQLILLSATGSTPQRHCRVLIALFVLLFVCVSYLLFLQRTNAFETWSFPLTVFVAEILINLLISAMIYFLNLIHSYRYTMWYEIYDYIYYLESAKDIITLVLSVLLLLTGINKLMESGSMLRLFFIFIHFYYNIWSQLFSGWHAWQERRLIFHSVNALPIASKKEDGVCAICLNDISKHITCITRCNHFYHSYCLRKWLCERKTCPICHRTILPSSSVNARERQRFHNESVVS
nr:protein TRC8 homolog isoform X2 [Parasteatoda tepidariorum]XP_015908680.1 protein TRC8 homolog isoform X2 [Parasteatoda tepidariorum]